jgi:hypothetical protein
MLWQAVKQLEEQVASLPQGACADLLILPLYAAMPLELQVTALLSSSSSSPLLSMLHDACTPCTAPLLKHHSQRSSSMRLLAPPAAC